MCMIMEPMQELMLFHQQTKSDPKTCLKQLLLNKYNVKIDDTRIQPTKRKRRKAPANVGTTGTTKKGRANANNMNGANVIGNNNIGFQNNLMPVPDPGRPPNMPPLASQDVLVVGEPSMLGADFGDENERRITRLENNQFDSTSINGMPNSNHNNNNSVSDGRLSQTPNSMSNSNSNNQIVSHQTSIQPNSIMQQNNYESAASGNMQQMMNHNNNIHTGVGNVPSSGNSANNNGIPECAPDTPNSGNSGNCLQSNTSVGANCNNHQMNLIPMNSNTNHINHITKSEMDLKQPMTTTGTSTSVTDTEAR